MRARLTECMSTAAIVPPASPIALVSTPNAPGSFGISMRMMTVKLIAGNAMVLPVYSPLIVISATRNDGDTTEPSKRRSSATPSMPASISAYAPAMVNFVDRVREFAVPDEKAACAAR